MICHEGSILDYQSHAARDDTTGDSVIALANLNPNGTDDDSATTIAGAIRKTLATQPPATPAQPNDTGTHAP